VITLEFLLCLLGFILVLYAFIDIALIIKEKLNAPEVDRKTTKIIEIVLRENNWEKNERPNFCD